MFYNTGWRGKSHKSIMLNKFHEFCFELAPNLNDRKGRVNLSELKNLISQIFFYIRLRNVFDFQFVCRLSRLGELLVKRNLKILVAN